MSVFVALEERKVLVALNEATILVLRHSVEISKKTYNNPLLLLFYVICIPSFLSFVNKEVLKILKDPGTRRR